MTKIPKNKPINDLEERTFFRRVGTKFVRLFRIWNLIFVWYLMLGIYDLFDI